MRAAVLLLLVCAAAPALADTRSELEAAGRLLDAGDYPAAEARVAPLAADASLLAADRAEAHRIRGLALFYLGRRDDADAELAAYLQLEPDGHLDPALHPPEAVVFLEDVRSRHAGKLRAARPKSKSGALNFLPPAGQFQNGDTTKGWIIGVAELTLLAVNLSTYAMLSSSCEADLTCDRSYSSAKTMRILNLGSGALLIGVVAYGVIDGYVGMSRNERKEQLRVMVLPVPGGAALGAYTAF